MKIYLIFFVLFSSLASAQDAETTNASTLYNLGNAHYQKGNYGEAIYAYEKALILDPGGSDIKSNLALARKAATAFDEENQPFAWLSFLYWVGYNQWAKGIVMSLFALALVSLLRAFHLLEKIPVSMKIPIVFLLVFIAIGIAALIVRHPELDRAIVVTNETKVLLSPFETADVKATLKAGQAVQIEQIHEDFYRIRDGWVSQNDVKPIYPRK